MKVWWLGHRWFHALWGQLCRYPQTWEATSIFSISIMHDFDHRVMSQMISYVTDFRQFVKHHNITSRAIHLLNHRQHNYLIEHHWKNYSVTIGPYWLYCFDWSIYDIAIFMDIMQITIKLSSLSKFWKLLASTQSPIAISFNCPFGVGLESLWLNATTVSYWNILDR